MDEATQSRLLERIAEHLAADGATTTDVAETTLSVDPSIYTDRDRWERERALLGNALTAVGLSGLLPGPAPFAAVAVG
ncbi:MAG: iron-sulfur protein, partial [Ilumatobacteraceae bacterium]